MSLIITKSPTSCELRKVAPLQTLEQGMVVAQVNGLVVPWSPTASDGSQFPVGIIPEPARTKADAAEKILVVRDAEVRLDHLVFYGGASERQKVECVAELRYLGIVAK
jgi:hypothetical protein